MNITIYYGNHEDKTIHTMDCHVDIDLDDGRYGSFNRSSLMNI